MPVHNLPENIILIGYRGSGKTSLGQEIARRTGYTFVDTDGLIVRQSKTSITEIFERFGQDHFRELEETIITEVTRFTCQIISTGGGVILRDKNIKALRDSGTVVWLTAPPEVLWDRTSRDANSASHRPSLSDRTGLEEVKLILSQRTPLYETAAHYHLDVTDRQIPELADSLLKLLNDPETSS